MKAETVPAHLTLGDVSRAAGVSEMTVSRVLRGKGQVSEATRRRVLSVARSLGYVPNKIAGALASSRVNLVGVVIPSLSNMVFPEVVDGIASVLEETPLQPVVGVTHYSAETEERVIYEMLSWRPSGLIVAGLEHGAAARAMLARAGVPVVEIMDVDGAPVDACVGISHLRAGREMARQIVARGYRRVALLGTGMQADHRARKRLDGAGQVLAEAGLAVVARESYTGGSRLSKGREMAAAVLARCPQTDCFYCTNDVIAAGALLHCLQAGFDVPGRIGIAGFNRLVPLEGLPMRLATMDSCRRGIGTAAARIVLDRISGAAPASGDRVELQPELIAGETLRALPGE